MTETTTVTVPRQTINLNLGALKTVLWLETNPVIEDVTEFSKRQCDRARQYKILDAFYTLIVFQLMWLYTLIHTLPWPIWSIKTIHRVDEVVESSLETVYTRLEWWWDYITINLMRAVETVVIYLDKLITFVDNVIGWLLQRYDWVFDIAQQVYATARGLCLWYIGLWTSAWEYIINVLNNLQQIWTASQEELQNSKEERQVYTAEEEEDKESLPEELPSPRTQRSFSLPEGQVLKTKKSLSFSTTEEIDYGSSAVLYAARNGRPFSRSDSEGSDVTGVSETRKLLVGEQTGRSYSRVHTEATVVGKQRAIMCERVTNRLKIMRKNSIRFSRGMDVRISTTIGAVRRKLTPRSLMSMLLTIIEFIILAPFKIVVWLIGGKRRSRLSRSMRTESMCRREAAAAAAASAGLPPRPLGPAALLQSAEPVVQTSSVRNTTVKEMEREESPDSTRRDSGVSEDNIDSSDGSNNGPPSPPVVARVSSPLIFHARNEKYLSLSSNSTISEEPDEDDVENSPPARTPTSPVSTPPTTPTAPKQKRCRFPSGDLDSSPPEHITSEPDLRASCALRRNSSPTVRQDWKRRSIGATPEDVMPIAKKKIGKRVTYKTSSFY